MRVGLVFVIVAMCLLSGCATSFKTPEPGINYGTPPRGYQMSIPYVFQTYLKDPSSATYRYESPVKGYLNKDLMSGGVVAWTGWMVEVFVNAKNAYGGYVGEKRYVVLFTGDKPVDMVDEFRYHFLHKVDTDPAELVTSDYNQLIIGKNTIQGLDVVVTRNGMKWDVAVKSNIGGFAKLIWSESAYVGTDGKSQRLIREVSGQFDTSGEQASSPIPPTGSLLQTMTSEGLIPFIKVGVMPAPTNPDAVANIFLTFEIDGRKATWKADIMFVSSDK